jgi:large subunit ribosomal protein L24
MKSIIKTGDTVKILSGDERGKQAKVLRIDRKKGVVLLEGINMMTHYTRKSEKDPKGGIVKREGFIKLSKVKKVEVAADTKTEKPKKEKKK